MAILAASLVGSLVALLGSYLTYRASAKKTTTDAITNELDRLRDALKERDEQYFELQGKVAVLTEQLTLHRIGAARLHGQIQSLGEQPVWELPESPEL